MFLLIITYHVNDNFIRNDFQNKYPISQLSCEQKLNI